MARSPATPLGKVALASTAYALFWALLVAVSVPPRMRPGTLAACASHAGGEVPWTAVAHRVYDEVERRMQARSPSQRHRIARTVLEESARAAIDPLLVLAVIQVESAFDPRAVSPVGAAGLMQLLGPTMREELDRWRLGAADPFDPVANVRAGVRYLERMLGAFDDLELALMAYNAGPGRIRRHLRDGGVPERFLAYPRSVGRVRARLAARGASATIAAAHAPPERGAPAGGTGELAPSPLRRPDPALGPLAPVAVAVPTGPRRRELTDT